MYQIRRRLHLLQRMQPHHSCFGFSEERTARGTLLAMSVKAQYFENAEEDLFRVLGKDRTDVLRDMKIFMPRTSLSCQFRSPAIDPGLYSTLRNLQRHRDFFIVHVLQIAQNHCLPQVRGDLL